MILERAKPLVLDASLNTKVEDTVASMSPSPTIIYKIESIKCTPSFDAKLWMISWEK